MDEGRSAETGPRQGRPTPLLVHVAGSEYRAHPDDGAVTIGREMPAQIRVDEPGISRMHVRLEPAGDHWTLTDSGSRNGVFLNGQRVDSATVDRALEVYLGHPEGVLVRLSPQVDTDTGPHPTDTYGAAVQSDAEPAPDEESTEAITPTVQVAVAVDAADIALRAFYARIAMLPLSEDPRFAAEAAALLAELRRLEGTLTNAAQNATGRPELAVALGEVRHAYTDLVRRVVRTDTATLGQRLYIARHDRQLTVHEAANAAGVTVADIVDAEAELAVSNAAAATLQRFVDILEQRERP